MSTVEHYGTLFPTAVVGSMPRPDFVREIVVDGRSEDPQRSTELMDRAVAYIVSLQEQSGLDILSDGEWRRASYIGVIAELAHGFELGEEDGRPWTLVTDKLCEKNAGFIAAEIRYLKSITSHRIKATLPAPALLGERMWDEKKSSGAYPTRRAFVEDCVPVLRHELELLRDEGVDVIQIDDPHLCLLVDDKVRAQYQDPDSEAAFPPK